MSLFFGRLLSVLALTMFITTSLKAQSITFVKEEIVDQKPNTSSPGAQILSIDPARMVSGYALNEMKLDKDLNKNTWKVANTLNHKLTALHNLPTDYLKNNPPTFQKDLFIKDISLKAFAYRRAVIAPVLLIAAGLSTLEDDNDDDNEVQEERNRYIPNFRNHADDYLQHAPIIAVYGLNWLGVEGKNDFANRTAILIKSEMMLGALTFSLKRITAVPRPDTKELTSFPSGHTAQAFAAATFMAREFGHKNIGYSIGAYAVATAVGTMRVMNNRHWMSDVLVGAGIGILTTNLVYLTHQYRWGKKSKRGQTIVMPSYDGQTGMVNIIHRIN